MGRSASALILCKANAFQREALRTLLLCSRAVGTAMAELPPELMWMLYEWCTYMQLRL